MKTVGPEHADTLSAMSNLASALSRTGDWESALALEGREECHSSFFFSFADTLERR